MACHPYQWPPPEMHDHMRRLPEACSNLHAVQADSRMKMCKAGSHLRHVKLLAHKNDMACSEHEQMWDSSPPMTAELMP